jgi:cyclic pyranopterin monophosphate synthase
MVNHLDKKNNPVMVDVGSKNITQRIAEAEGEVIFDKNTFKKIENLRSKKGSIKSIAILAGIMGAKETSRLIPLCHNIPIDSVNVQISKNIKKNLMKVNVIVKTNSKTGVEMEALTAVSISCLTIYDMCKYLNQSIKINNIKLISKKGGKSGNYKS